MHYTRRRRRIVPLHHAHLLSKLCAVDAVVAHSCMTDLTWEPTWTLQEVQACTVHHVHLPSTPSPPCFYSISRASWHVPPAIQWWLQDDLYRYPARELQSVTHVTCPQHNDEEQRAKHRAMVDPNIHNKLLAVTINITDMASRIGVHSLGNIAFSAPTR